MNDDLSQVFQRLHGWCESQQWRGFDPYDALNSPVARWLPGKLARQAWTQFHRRSPINLRPLCGIKPSRNAKALALFAMGSREPRFLEMLAELRNPDGGWGYPFPWQSRAFFAPATTSNLICTAFAARAFDKLGQPCGAKEFIASQLIRQRNGERWITYVPGSDTQVHNINLLGAAVLGRRDCLEFSVRRQRPDGSWWYGEAANQHWIDNFHTGYCLVALREMGGFAEATQRGYQYWDRTFWEADGAPRYYNNQKWPVDIHCCAQGIITYLAFGDRAAATRVAHWTVANLWDERGFFWYQRRPAYTNRIPYLRWAEAWMYYALAELERSEVEA